MMRRLLSVESDAVPELRQLFEVVDQKLHELLSYLESNREYRAIEVRELVQIQLAAGLYTALYIQTAKGI
jgi:hypothetical protein